MSSSKSERETPFLVSLVAGGIAGTSVDISLYPIDTLKTRLQSPKGFMAAGGFRGVYNGLGAAAIGSAPGAALFFSTYEFLKVRINNQLGDGIDPAVGHCTAASFGGAAACFVRVPTEVIKQNMQIGGNSLKGTVNMVLAQKESGAFLSSSLGGLYRGYGITLMREIPFAFIQFPMYERMKVHWSNYRGEEVNPVQAALCGSISGGFASALTTPLDVIKTRLMLGEDKHGIKYKNAADVFGRVMREEGWKTLFSGIQPRVIWISIGGFVFFGAFEEYRSLSMIAGGYE